MVSCRSAANWLSLSAAVSWPLITTVPLVGRSSPPIRLSRVDLPLPEGPIRQTNSPGSTVRCASTRALTTSSPSLCSFQAPVTSTTGSVVVCGVASSASVIGQAPEVREWIGGREAARQVGRMLVATAASALTTTATSTPSAVPPGGTPDAATPAAASTAAAPTARTAPATAPATAATTGSTSSAATT